MYYVQESKIPTYQRMWNFMENKEPTVFVKTSTEGIERVRKGGYAFLMESTMIDYQIQRYCDLMQVGGLLDTKGYGVGTPRGNRKSCTCTCITGVTFFCSISIVSIIRLSVSRPPFHGNPAAAGEGKDPNVLQPLVEEQWHV